MLNCCDAVSSCCYNFSSYFLLLYYIKMFCFIFRFPYHFGLLPLPLPPFNLCVLILCLVCLCSFEHICRFSKRRSSFDHDSERMWRKIDKKSVKNQIDGEKWMRWSVCFFHSIFDHLINFVHKFTRALLLLKDICSLRICEHYKPNTFAQWWTADINMINKQFQMLELEDLLRKKPMNLW